MTDPAEDLLRDVLTEDAALAPAPGDLGGAARLRLRRKRRRQRTVAGASLALVALAGGVTLANQEPPSRHGVTGTPSPDPASYPALTSHRWLLVEVVRDGQALTAAPVESFIGFHGDGRFSGYSCNRFGGRATITPTHVALSDVGSTNKACHGHERAVEEAVRLVARERLAWEVDGDVLRLTAADGDRLVYRAYAEPDPFAGTRVLMRESDGAVEYGLAVSPSGDVLHFAVRRGATYSWRPHKRPAPAQGPSGLRSLLLSGYGDRVFVGGWATGDATRAVHVADTDSTPVELTLYDVAGSDRKVFGGFVDDHSASSRLTLYQSDGSFVVLD